MDLELKLLKGSMSRAYDSDPFAEVNRSRVRLPVKTSFSLRFRAKYVKLMRIIADREYTESCVRRRRGGTDNLR